MHNLDGLDSFTGLLKMNMKTWTSLIASFYDFIGFSGSGEEWTVFTGCPRPLIGRTQTVQSWWSVWGAQAQDTLNLEGRRGLHFPVWPPGFKFRHHHLPTVRCGEDLPVTWSSDRALFPGLLWSLDLLTDIRAVFRKYANQCGHRVVCT